MSFPSIELAPAANCSVANPWDGFQFLFAVGKPQAQYLGRITKLRRKPMPNWSSSCHSHRIIRLLGPPLLDDSLRCSLSARSCPPQTLCPAACFSLRRFRTFVAVSLSLCTSSRAVTNKSGFGNERLLESSGPSAALLLRP
uniref:uncharacterized protein LOC117606479 n=1 Tax=Osmia lignaria TaxID=473952 RepID=UPI00147924F0|nr:uncharacterized protein LOC117606479 [Osmia lignaria]